jgi:ribonucleoside-diphosphate reductase alpha chain
MWDMGGGAVLCDKCHNKWLKTAEAESRKEKKSKPEAVVLTGTREENEAVMTGGTSPVRDQVLETRREVKPEPPKRHKLPNERHSLTHKFTILARNPDTGEPEEVKGYLTVGLYNDGSVGEIFVKMAKQGSQVSGFVDAWAISVSMLLQMRVPLEVIVNRFENMRFEPSGRIKGQSVLALSPIDYVCGYLRQRFLKGDDRERVA